MKERKEQFAAFAGGDGTMLVVEKKIPPRLSYRLQAYVAEYLTECLEAFECNDPLKLPNRTHNGKLEPKWEHLPLFNDIEEQIVHIVGDIFPDGVHSVRAPINIRVKNGGKSEEDNRAYATSKPHTDVWAGDPANTAVIIIPVLGDIETQGLRFGEPAGICDPYNFERQHANYERGMESITGVRWYDLKMKANHAYIVDSWCIHHSVMNGGSRVSIDTRVSYGYPQEAQYSNLYLPYEQFITERLSDAETVEQTIEKYGAAA